MGKRKKLPEVTKRTAIQDFENADGRLLDLGKAQIALQKLEADMNIRINGIKEQFAAKAIALATDAAHIEGEIKQFFEENVGLMAGPIFKGSWGKITYRLNPPKITLLRGKKEAGIVAALQAAGRDDVLRTTIVLNRQAILEAGLDEELDKLGVRVTRTQTFKAAPDLVKIATQAPAPGRDGVAPHRASGLPAPAQASRKETGAA